MTPDFLDPLKLDFAMCVGAYEININNCVLTFSSLFFCMFDLPKEVNCQLPKAVSICVECLLHHEKKKKKSSGTLNGCVIVPEMLVLVDATDDL